MGQEPEELRADIARTRAELDQDLDVLAEKVSPNKVLERRVDATKSALGGVKDKVMGSAHSAATSASDGASGVASTASSAPGAVKTKAAGNPLAAGLVAFGVGWLASSLLPSSQVEARAASQLKDAVAEPLKEQLTTVAGEVKDELAPAVQEAAESVKSTATDAVGTVKEQAADATATVKEQAATSAGEVAGHAKEATTQVQDVASSHDRTVSTPASGTPGY